MKKICPILIAAVAVLACGPKSEETPYSRKIDYVEKHLSRNGDRFVYFCDCHTDKEESCVTPDVLDEILSKITVEKVIFGGDFCMTLNGCADKEDLDRSVANFEKNVNCVKSHGSWFYPVRGNHDITTGTVNPEHEGFTYSQAHVHETLLGFAEGAPLIESGDLSLNYYVDREDRSIRYIFLDPYSSPEEDVIQRYAVKNGNAEVAREWCRECLTTLPEGWKAVILLHHGINRVTGCCFHKRMRDILEIVRENSSRVVMVLHGHTHKDAETFDHGVLHVCTTASLYNESKGDLFGPVSRIHGTADETALDVIDVNVPRGKINMWRVGFGYDRLVNIKPLTVKVGDRLKLRPSLAHTDSWKIYDADGVIVSSWVDWEKEAVILNNYATLEGATLKAAAPGEVVVIATDETSKSREYFYVVVEQPDEGQAGS